ncbi:fructosamine kinase family protein [Gleimia hominis]|uniref:Fructosamine kinase family protein n=1 Tax=Gleimia hominis TaxID=595468 RepID=A0ABU3I8F7_9ACTO|nr:fructosamine kinase family protein [Gleimia hominis]MDT3766665.1 fructosamine kinase family protein [Gleimia hominis]
MGISRIDDVYIKTDSINPTNTELEAFSLTWLAEGEEYGGAHVVPVVSVKRGELRTRAVGAGSVTRAAARQFGRALAVTHAVGADYFGQPPAGWSGNGWMGRSELAYPSAERALDSWGAFLARDRILPNLKPAVDNGSIDGRGAAVVERLCERLRDGEFDSPQPGLVRTAAARIHGDLWTGNVIWSATADLPEGPRRAGLGSREGAALADVTGVLIDPAAQGGHAESDLAALGVFGQRYLEDIYAGYNEESALADGWESRIGLHQLHMLIVHANLFGGGYGAETVSVARRYL